MSERACVHWSAQIDELCRDGDSWRIADQLFGMALIAVPAEQAKPLRQPWEASFAMKAADTRSAPCWTVMAAFAGRLPIAAAALREEGPIGWAARNSAKPGRSGPESWVVQAGPDWSHRHLEEAPADIVAPLLDALAQRAGSPLPTPLSAAAHWVALCQILECRGRSALERRLRLGARGDWLIGPRVEAAWLSGQTLAEALLSSSG